MLGAVGARCTSEMRAMELMIKIRTSYSNSEKFASTSQFSWHPWNLQLHCVYEVDYFDGNDQASYKV